MRFLFIRIMLVVATLVCGSVVMAADHANCTNLRSDDLTLTNPGKGPWDGTATLMLDGEVIAGDVKAVQDLKSIRFFPDGSYEGFETADFTSAAGNFHVEDWYRVEPTDTPGKLMFHAEGNIVSGEGRFAGTFGRLKIRGPIYVDPERGALAELKVNGSLCTLSQ